MILVLEKYQIMTKSFFCNKMYTVKQMFNVSDWFAQSCIFVCNVLWTVVCIRLMTPSQKQFATNNNGNYI